MHRAGRRVDEDDHLVARLGAHLAGVALDGVRGLDPRHHPVDGARLLRSPRPAIGPTGTATPLGQLDRGRPASRAGRRSGCRRAGAGLRSAETPTRGGPRTTAAATPADPGHAPRRKRRRSIVGSAAGPGPSPPPAAPPSRRPASPRRAWPKVTRRRDGRRRHRPELRPPAGDPVASGHVTWARPSPSTAAPARAGAGSCHWGRASGRREVGGSIGPDDHRGPPVRGLRRAGAASSSPRVRSTTSTTSTSGRGTMVGPYTCLDRRHGAGPADGDRSGGAHRRPLRHRARQPHRRPLEHRDRRRHPDRSLRVHHRPEPHLRRPRRARSVGNGRSRRRVRIGSGSWLGANAVILPGRRHRRATWWWRPAPWCADEFPTAAWWPGCPPRIVRRWVPEPGLGGRSPDVAPDLSGASAGPPHQGPAPRRGWSEPRCGLVGGGGAGPGGRGSRRGGRSAGGRGRRGPSSAAAWAASMEAACRGAVRGRRADRGHPARAGTAGRQSVGARGGGDRAGRAAQRPGGADRPTWWWPSAARTARSRRSRSPSRWAAPVVGLGTWGLRPSRRRPRRGPRGGGGPRRRGGPRPGPGRPGLRPPVQAPAHLGSGPSDGTVGPRQGARRGRSPGG